MYIRKGSIIAGVVYSYVTAYCKVYFQSTKEGADAWHPLVTLCRQHIFTRAETHVEHLRANSAGEVRLPALWRVERSAAASIRLLIPIMRLLIPVMRLLK